MSRGAALAYKPVGMLLGVAAGAVAGAVFERVWSRVSGSAEAPEPTQESSGWGEVLAAAALQGAVFALVRAATSKAGAAGFRRVTGVWPH